MDEQSVLGLPIHDTWVGFRDGQIGQWLATTGLHIAVVVTAACAAAQLVRWIAGRLSRRLDASHPTALVHSERVKHRKAVASVISSMVNAMIGILVFLDILNELGLPVSSLAAPAAVLGAALGFGAQRIVQDILSGFFIIVERHYGFGDLVQLTMTGSASDAMGTVEDVTLRVTKLRNTDGEVYTISNGSIVKSRNLSKDWARAVVDIPVPASADISRVNDILRDVSAIAMEDARSSALLLDEPSVMGIESFEKDTVNLRLVARTLPGKQFEVARRLRAMVIARLPNTGVHTESTAQP
jgi:moderate conductance mechanosensitive channel